MLNLVEECTFIVLCEKNIISDFDCGDEELNDFFNYKALPYRNELLARTCFFRHDKTNKIVCAFSISPNALKTKDLPNSRSKKVRGLIPREKTLQSYPAFLIGRLGVSKEFNGKGIGSQLMNTIKMYCLDNYSDFCRFLLIDAYNSVSILNFYQKNGFTTVFSTEEQEKSAYKIAENEPLSTRYLFFDMIQFKNKYL